MTTRYHLTAAREKTIVPTDSTIWIACPVEHPDAERFDICDDRCMIVATCYSRKDAQTIVTLANKALDAVEADERIVGAIPDLLRVAEALLHFWTTDGDGDTNSIEHPDGETINVRNLIRKATP